MGQESYERLLGLLDRQLRGADRRSKSHEKSEPRRQTSLIGVSGKGRQRSRNFQKSSTCLTAGYFCQRSFRTMLTYQKFLQRPAPDRLL